MLAVQGYYDGIAVRPLEKVIAKPNQKVIITILDEFVEPAADKEKKGMRGVLEAYSDRALAEKEKGAWEHAMVEKYGNV